MSAGKLVRYKKFFRGFFKKSISAIVKHIDEILQEPKAIDVEVIYAVGEFSNCLLVQNAISVFAKNIILLKEEHDLVVLKGAVCLGHFPNAFSRRHSQTKPELKKKMRPKEVSF